MKAGRDRDKHRGGAKINLVLTLLILCGMIFVGVMIAPPYFNNYQLQDAMKTEARFAGYNRKSDEEIREDMWKKVQELGIPVKKEDIHIVNENNTVQITVNYSIPVDMKFTQFTMDFHAHGDNHSL
ncbi:MAG: DUF4845 domain-containing protein [Candidatus Acidiferrales bacterium]